MVSVVGERTWTRKGIDLKIRSLWDICILAALGRNSALKLNFEMALNNGATIEEIFQVAASSGFPAAWDALIKLEDLLGEIAQDD